MHLSELKSKPVTELVEIANTNEIDGANRLRKQELVFALLKNQAKKGEAIFGDGTLEVLPDARLERGGLRVETKTGGAEDGPGQWRQAIAEAIELC